MILSIIGVKRHVTIKNYSPLTHLYTLDIPNKEVRMGLMKLDVE
nr:hypothetical protein [Bacteroides muris (ex Fokt et al. 2023)]